MRMDDEKLQLLGIENATHRYEIIKEIYKQVSRPQTLDRHELMSNSNCEITRNTSKSSIKA